MNLGSNWHPCLILSSLQYKLAWVQLFLTINNWRTCSIDTVGSLNLSRQPVHNMMWYILRWPWLLLFLLVQLFLSLNWLEYLQHRYNRFSQPRPPTCSPYDGIWYIKVAVVAVILMGSVINCDVLVSFKSRRKYYELLLDFVVRSMFVPPK